MGGERRRRKRGIEGGERILGRWKREGGCGRREKGEGKRGGRRGKDVREGGRDMGEGGGGSRGRCRRWKRDGGGGAEMVRYGG